MSSWDYSLYIYKLLPFAVLKFITIHYSSSVNLVAKIVRRISSIKESLLCSIYVSIMPMGLDMELAEVSDLVQEILIA